MRCHTNTVGKKWLAFILLLMPLCSHAQLSTTNIVNNAWCPECIQWKVSGACFWLTCTPLGCESSVSVKVSHFIPEAVVTSYSADSPWEGFPGGVNAGLSTGDTQTISHKAQDAGHLRFKNVDIIGSPAITLFNSLAQRSDEMCPTSAQAYFPYFRSTLDFTGWHLGIPEMFYPASYLGNNIDNGLNVFSPNYTNWGNLYPRHGFLIQNDDYRAAAVMAQRAADIVTAQSPQPHLYYPMPSGSSEGSDCGDKKCWPPGPAELKQPATHQWQKLYPVMEKSCAVFGTSIDAGAQLPDQKYAWHLWRPWECCSAKGSIYLGSISI